MKVLAQKNIWQEHAYDRLLQSFKNIGDEVIEIELVPFSEKLDWNGECDLVLGSTRFVDLARDKGLPVFKSFDPIVQGCWPHWHWINGDGEYAKWGKLIIDEPVFVKPKREKFFTGRVILNQEDKEKVQLTTSGVDDENEEIVWVSSPVNLKKEYRFFVINRKLITGSLYKEKGQLKTKLVDKKTTVWNYAKNLLEKDIIQYPDDSFVIDIGIWDYDTDEEYGNYGIVELNNINSSGIYDCDTNAIAKAFHETL